MRSVAPFGAVVLLFGVGCATQSDVQFVRQDLRSARTQAADAQAATESLRRDLEALRGEIEQIRFQTGSASRMEDVAAHLEALDARVAALELALRGGAAPGTFGEESGFAVTEGEIPGAPAVPTDYVGRNLEAELSAPGAPQEYREGIDLLRRGSHQEAIQKLREFLRRSPKSELADNGQYWIGEAYYSMRDYNRAILEFNEVLLRYPKGDKVPAALLRQAYAFADLGDKVDARLVLQKLVSDHGGTPEAEQARQKLAELSS